VIQREAGYFFAALRFFTRLPIPTWVGHSAEQLNHAARYFPLVGVIVGAIGAGATLAAAQVWPTAIAVLIGMAATLLATGAFHEDGLADTVDCMGGGWTREDVLRIMKDSRIGSYGAIGIGVMLLAKFEALVNLGGLPDTGYFISPWLTFFAAIVAGHGVSRFASTTLIHALDYARDDDSATSKPLATRMGKGELALAGLFGLAPCVVLPWPKVAVALALVALVTWLAARWFDRRIGGYTGDCLGATQQLTELAFYLGLLCACI
jgi:adenosylcobinamide-GDP ribazoletransferase